MRLRLEDGGRRGQKKMIRRIKEGNRKVLYNPKTGVGIVLNKPAMNDDDPLGLSGIFKQIKAKKKIKKAQKLKRFEQKQTAKTERQAQRQERKQTRLTARTQTQQNKLNKRIAKGDAQVAKQRAKQAEAEAQEQAAWEPTYSGESDEIPEGTFDVPGGDPMINPEDYGGDTDTIDVDAEEVPEEQLSEGGELNLKSIVAFIDKLQKGKAINAATKSIATIDTISKEIDGIRTDIKIIRKTIAPESELSAGWIDGVIKIGKGIVGGVAQTVAPDSGVAKTLLKIKDSKTGQAVKKVVDSKTGQAVKSAVTSGRELALLKTEVSDLRSQNAALKMQRNILIGTNILTTGTSVVLAVSKRRR